MTPIKPTKAVRAAAPDLFGQPAYFKEPNHQAAHIEQLKAVDMMPAAWALEDLLAGVDTLDEQTEELETAQEDLESTKKEVTELEKELARYKSFFTDVVRAFEEAPGAGYWPAAEPDDFGLVRAIADQLQGVQAEAA
jgi:hypothetical protein